MTEKQSIKKYFVVLQHAKQSAEMSVVTEIVWKREKREEIAGEQ